MNLNIYIYLFIFFFQIKNNFKCSCSHFSRFSFVCFQRRKIKMKKNFRSIENPFFYPFRHDCMLYIHRKIYFAFPSLCFVSLFGFLWLWSAKNIFFFRMKKNNNEFHRIFAINNWKLHSSMFIFRNYSYYFHPLLETILF